MDYFLGVDIGTTSVKAIAFHEGGDIIARHAVSYEMHHPQANYSEQDPEEILAGTVRSISEVIRMLQPAKPLLISFSAAMHSLIAVGEGDSLLTSCIIWADNRAAAIAGRLLETPKADWLYHTTGVPVHAMSPLCKLLWLKENEPDTFYAASKFIGIKEFIFHRLFGAYAIDTAMASATGLLNLASLQWDKAILDFIGLEEDKLSAVVPVEKVFHYTAHNTASQVPGLSAGVPVVIGSSDGALANLGTGSPASTSMSVTIGTSGAVRILSGHPATGKVMSIFCYHAMGDQYIIGGASNNGAIVIQWLKESVLQTQDGYPQLFQQAQSVQEGSDDLYFIPFILGERAPVWNSDARGVFFGLGINHTKAHLLRAAMEGITYNLFTIGRQLMELMDVNEIYASGGFAQSPLWLQMLADVFNCRVLVSGSLESSALGAVMLGIKALGMAIEIRPAIIAEYHPNIPDHENYQRRLQKFEHLYQVLKPEFSTQPVVVPVSAT